MLLGHHAGLAAMGSHAMAGGAVLPQSLLMAQHPGTQQTLMLTRQDPASLAGLVGHTAILPGLTAQQGLAGLHDYQHGLMGQQQAAMARGELQAAGLGQIDQNAPGGLLAQGGGQMASWTSEQQLQPTQSLPQQDVNADRLRKYVDSSLNICR